MMRENKIIILLLILSIVLISLFLFTGLNEKNYKYALSKRIPRVMAIVMMGIAISTSSLIFQTVMDNRILTPSILGLDSLYILIQTSMIFLLGVNSKLAVAHNLNFIISVMLMIFFSLFLFKYLFKKTNNNLMKLLLVGIIMGTLFESLGSFMQMAIDPNEFLHVQDKMYASFNVINSNILLISSFVIILSFIYIYKNDRNLDVLSLGRDQAINLGVEYDRLNERLLIIVSLLVSVSTALVGPITFLGLLVVNLARQLGKTYRHSHLIILSSLISIVFLIGGQFIIEKVLNFGTPISVIINLVGGIYFIFLLVKEGIIRNVSKTYGDKKVLNDVSLDIKKESITSFIGPNGAGKSTLLSIISRIMKDYDGEVVIDGIRLEDWNNKELSKKIGILRQSNNINIRLTIRELVAFGRFPHNQGKLTKEDEEYIDKAIKYMKLKDIEDRYLDQLSGGQKQRAYIAMVLAQDTEYILLDEPLNNLDMKHSVEIMKILRDLVEKLKKTIIIVIHDINFASVYSDYILALKDGKVVEHNRVDEIINNYTLKCIYDLDFTVTNINNKRLCVYF
ncbi:MAG: iron chelate uptake ABC transporter family permease subunit [Tissierellaceae bacterium]